MFIRILATFGFMVIYTMIAMILDEALQLQYNFFQISIPFVTIGFYWYLKSKHKSIKKEILRKYVEKNKYLSGYYKSSFFDKLKVLKQNNSFDEIIKICDQYLKNNNPHPLVKAELWNEIGFSYKMIGENYKAIEMFVKVLKIDNEHLDASEGLAQTYLKLKDYDSAIEWLQKSEEYFKRAINDSKILGAPNNKIRQLTDDLNTIEILLESLKSGYEPE